MMPDPLRMEADVLNGCERQYSRVTPRTDFKLGCSEFLFKVCDFVTRKGWVSYYISVPPFLHLYNTEDNGLDPEESLN